MVKATAIKEWAEDDRPREKMLASGRGAVSDSELLAIILGSGSRSESAVQLAKRILASVGNNWKGLGRLQISDLMRFKGVGEAKAVSVAAAMEIGRRRAETAEEVQQPIVSSKMAFDAIKAKLSDLSHEEFWVLLLNRANKIIRKTLVSRGGVSGTVVDSRVVFKAAVGDLAAGLILCHNHPSGNLKPSVADKKLTEKIIAGAQLLDLQILDHLIIGDQDYFSFADNGLL